MAVCKYLGRERTVRGEVLQFNALKYILQFYISSVRDRIRENPFAVAGTAAADSIHRQLKRKRNNFMWGLLSRPSKCKSSESFSI